VVDLIRRHRASLAAVPNAFVSVSLSAASRDRGDLDGLARCVADIERRTGWTPDEVQHVAGAFRFSRYGRGEQDRQPRRPALRGQRRRSRRDPGALPER
jgi:menaquinone-dependent protoporphyrinogen IX oxidase